MLKLYVMIERILIVPFQNRTYEFCLTPSYCLREGRARGGHVGNGTSHYLYDKHIHHGGHRGTQGKSTLAVNARRVLPAFQKMQDRRSQLIRRRG